MRFEIPLRIDSLNTRRYTHLMSEGTKRRLAAIVSADVVGYSRLMGADEAGTLAAMHAHRAELWDPLIEKFGGRVVGTAGDSILVEFASAVAAVESSIEVQRGMVDRNTDMPGDKCMLLRIGINIGEVIIEGDNIYGDGVNIAARLQKISMPSGIAMSGNIQEQIDGKLEEIFTDDGLHELKNISRPVQVWRWPVVSDTDVVSTGPDEDVSLPLPDKASIAVLPLESMSDSRDHEYLADGMTEDIITLLARIPSFFVIARNSSFSYKGQRPDIRQVGRELGVRYVVEGSLRPVGNRLRVTIQLIEAESGNHLWAERFDRVADDLFEVQDEITTAIVARLEPELNRSEFELIRRRPIADLDAWDYYQQASNMLALKGWGADTFAESIDHCRKAISLDPDFAPARAMLSLLLAIGHLVGHVTETDEALEAADHALALDSDNSEVLGYAGCALCDLGNSIRGIEILERAIERDPSNAQAWVALGASQLTNRQPERAVESLAHGLRISPRDNRLGFWGATYALALGFVDRVDEGIEQARIACRHDNNLVNPRVVLAVLLIAKDRLDEAGAALAEARRIQPDFSLRDARGLVGGPYAKSLEKIWPA